MKKVLVFGTFDIFHEGHKSFLRQAKKHGDFLRVVVARDATVENVKKQKPLNGEWQRLQMIQASGLANEVLLGNLEDKYKVVEEYRPDSICLGYDQEFFVEGLTQKLNELGLRKTKIVRLSAYCPEKYKSSILRAALVK